MFEEVEKLERTASVKELENYIKLRLDSIFPYVSNPFRLPKQRAQLYSFFLCVSNPNYKAIALAKKVSNFILNKH